MTLNANPQRKTLRALHALYEKTFPRSEKKPFFVILQKRRKGTMEIISVEDENGGFLGFAITILHKDIVLLDYFAISPTCRGKGIGTKVLEALEQRYEGKRILLEIEDPDEPADISLSRIGTCTLSGQKHAVVKVDASGENTYAASINGLIYALSHCLAAGISPKDVGLSCHLTLPMAPPSPKKLGCALGAILGLYRVQMEFELRGNAPVLRNTSNEDALSAIAMIAPLSKKTLPPTVVGGGSMIYYLEPLYDENGLPVFEDLKKMYGYIEKLYTNSLILSIRPTSKDLLADLDAMSRDVTVDYVREDSVTSHFGGFLIETTARIQGTLVAQTYSHQTLEETEQADEI